MIIVVLFIFLTGCVAQQADLLQTEKALQQRIKQQDDQLSQTRARQSQEISTLRDQDLPHLRGELERALHQTQDIQAKQEDLKHRLAHLEQQAKKLEQLTAKMDADNTTRHAWVQKSIENQDAKFASKLEEFSKSMDHAVETLKRDIVDVVQRTNDTLSKRVDAKLDDQHKGLSETQHHMGQVSEKFSQFNQALTGFREALVGLNGRVEQQEQTTQNVAALAKTLEAMKQQAASRFEEQDRRIESLVKSVEQAGSKPGRQQATKSSQRPTASAAQDGMETGPAAVTIVAPQEPPVLESGQNGAEAADRVKYEQVLTVFRGGDLEGARQGFAAFLLEYPNSDLAPNARYWQGEAYYGKKDFQKAIDAYGRVETDYPRSEKVPAAMLKKGYAYLALKDVKRASSAFNQVLTLYPKSPEAGKASGKLAQLKEVR
ncbi:MAG TPA: tol-pal system protein YbgF [Nitrospira sp.]|nr:tol-pal system protein YbgF [Nitrospira sp.]